MLNKKTIIIIFFSIIVMASAVIFFYFFQNKKVTTSQEAQPSTSVPVFLPFSKDISVNDINNEKEIQSTFSDYITGESKNDIQKIQFKDRQGQVVSLEKLSASIKFNVEPAIKNIVSKNNYSVFSCVGENGKKDFGLIFNIRRFRKDESVDYGKLYKDTENKMKNWENSMLKDLHSVLFPNVQFSENQLNQKLEFKDGKYRFAGLNLPDGSNGSLNYTLLGDPIVISTSVECMDKAVGNFFDE